MRGREVIITYITLSVFLLTVFSEITLNNNQLFGIKVEIQTENFKVDLKNEKAELIVHLTYSIPKKTIFLPNWQIPDDHMQANLFEINSLSTGDKVSYIGALSKRIFREEDLISLEPNQPITSRINLLNFYDFKEGVYQIRLNSYHNVNTKFDILNMNLVQLASNYIEVQIVN